MRLKRGLDDIGTRHVGGRRHGDHPPSRRFNFSAAYNLIRRPAGSFDQHLRHHAGDHGLRRWVIEDGDVIDRCERRQRFRSLLLGENWSARTFQGTDAGVGVDRYDQDIAQIFGRRQVAGVAEMNEIKTPVRENDALALALQIVHHFVRALQGENLRRCRPRLC
jgi:hypothetical protein